MPDQTGPTPDPFVNATLALSDDEFFALYGPWTPMTPEEIGEMLSDCTVGWHIAGGRAARVSAAATRHHEDTDVVVLAKDLDAIRAAMPGWHLWENINGAFRPLLPGIPDRPECQQVWARRDARSPWRLEFLVDRASTPEEWVFKRDHSVRVPWNQALHQFGGVTYLKPELALLFKAGQDREKDREDLAAARLTPEVREWLAVTLERLGYATWAELTRRNHEPVNKNPTSHRT
jgi:hypothetical protein